MIKDGKILLGKAQDQEIFMIPSQMNRHGLIAGASGTGKTTTLRVIAEGLSDIGVPCFVADVKGDLSGLINPGDMERIQGRVDSMGLEGFTVTGYPCRFFDVYRKKGHPIRAVMQQVDPVLLSRILDLTDAQQGVLNIIFRVAEDMDLDIINMEDLKAMCAYVGDHSKEYTVKYGNVSKQSIGGIQRRLLELENQQGNLLFGMPQLDINDLLTRTYDGRGMISMLECDELFHHPMTYSTFLLWLLDSIYRELPEVGDLDKPKMVFFFDEAHLLFDNTSRQLMEKIEQIIKLIRSKGVGIFFITQSPTDLPNSVLAQLSNRIQHALRAYTPSEIKNVKLAADAFRVNPELDTATVITEMKTGYALVSVLDEDGAPTIVQHTKICPPRSNMDIAPDADRQRAIENDSAGARYDLEYDPVSAFESMDEIYAAEEEEKARLEEEKKQAKLEEQRLKQEAREQAKREKEGDWLDQLSRKAKRKAQNELVNAGIRSARKFLKGLFK